jgi:hypothetical protein
MILLDNLIGAMQVGGTLVLSPFLRGWYNTWGAMPVEVQRSLPGDELAPQPMLGYTRAITIRAGVEQVWAWLVQMGQGRGGLYSYDGLENLAGCKIHSVERILPEQQTLQEGDVIRLGPPGYPCFAVAEIEPPRVLVLLGADPKSGQALAFQGELGKGVAISTWQFILEKIDAHNTRLVVRQRLMYSSEMGWIWRLTEPVGFVMERKMLLGIRQRAEGKN